MVIEISRLSGVPAKVDLHVNLDGHDATTLTIDFADPANGNEPIARGFWIGRWATSVDVVLTAYQGGDKVGVSPPVTWTAALGRVSVPLSPPDLGQAGTGGAGGMAGAGGSGTGGISGFGGAAGAPDGGAGGAGDPHADAGIDGCDTPDMGTDAHVVTYTCQDYCNAIAAGNLLCQRLYSGPDDCLATCQSFGWTEKSSAPNAHENTIECRLEYMGGSFCEQGAPSGGGQCPASRCRPYCDVFARNCAGTAAAGQLTDCMTECQNASFTWGSAVLVDHGDVGECFLYWAAHAGRPGAVKETECANALPGSAACH